MIVNQSKFPRASSDVNDKQLKKTDLRRLIQGGPQASTRVTYIDLCSNPVSGHIVQTGGRSPGASAMVTNLQTAGGEPLSHQHQVQLH